MLVATLRIQRLFSAAQISAACAFVWVLLDFTRSFLGRPAAWALGFVILFFAALGFFRLRRHK
jgi:hypothetical protein